MENTTAKPTDRWDITFRLMCVVSVLVFTWFYNNADVYDGAAAFFMAITFLTCYYTISNQIRMRRKTLTARNFKYWRFYDLLIAFLTCLCMTLETLILHRPFTF